MIACTPATFKCIDIKNMVVTNHSFSQGQTNFLAFFEPRAVFFVRHTVSGIHRTLKSHHPITQQ